MARRARGSLTGRAVPSFWANRLTRSSSSSQATSTTSGAPRRSGGRASRAAVKAASFVVYGNADWKGGASFGR